VKRWRQLGIGGCLLLMALGWWSPARAGAEIYGDLATKRYHTAECPETPLIKNKNQKIFDSEAEARAKGFYPCPLCSPPLRKDNAAVVNGQRKLSQTVSHVDGYVVDKAAKTYHQTWCPLLKKIDPRQLRKVADIEKAASGGNSPCAVCNPPVAFVRALVLPGNGEKASAPPPPKLPVNMGGKIGDKELE
jgi:hypothetical protein